MVQSFTRFGPMDTPKTIWRLMIATVIVSLCSALWENFLTLLLGWPPLQSIIALSLWGVKHLMIWQFLTYVFVINSYGAGITFFYLVVLLLTMYVMWIFSTTVYEFGGRRQFLQLYFLSTWNAGLAGILMTWLFGYHEPFAGPTAPLLALFTVWCFLHPEDELLLFFFLPIKSKWLFTGVIGAILLVGIAQLNLVDVVFYLTAIYTGYVYAAMTWEVTSPFAITSGFDRKLINWGRAIRARGKKQANEPKVVKLFKAEADLDDDAFIDAMLNKISTKGTDSLSRSEKKRMDEIASKRQKK